MAGVSGPAGVGEQGQSTRGVPRNLGAPSVSIARAGGDRHNQLQVKPQPHVLGCGDKQGTKRWYRPAKATKRGETDGRESQRLIVARKRGNGPSRTPWSEGGAALQTRGRNHAEGIEPPSVSPPGGWIVRGTANLQRDEPDASLRRTSGSVGALGTDTQRDPARRFSKVITSFSRRSRAW
jgi:hypothetical protein